MSGLEIGCICNGVTYYIYIVLVLGCIDASDNESRRVLKLFRDHLLDLHSFAPLQFSKCDMVFKFFLLICGTNFETTFAFGRTLLSAAPPFRFGTVFSCIYWLLSRRDLVASRSSMLFGLYHPVTHDSDMARRFSFFD